MPSNAVVLLLKDPPELTPADPYARSLLVASYSPRWISPLSTVPTNEEALRKIIEDGPRGRWRGVIVTSKRAVVAWRNAARSIEQERKEAGKGKGKQVDKEPGQGELGWDSVPFFAVGPATAEAISTLPGLSARQVLGAEESGTGSSLADFIVSHFSSSLPSTPSSTPPLPLLYLTGDKRSPALPETLATAMPPIPFVEQEVYATAPSPTVTDEISALFDAAPGSLPRWIVLFSPSGGKAVVPVLRERGLLGIDRNVGRVKVAAIGPTTETWLKENEGVVPDAVASRPEAQALVEALVAADRGVFGKEVV